MTACETLWGGFSSGRQLFPAQTVGKIDNMVQPMARFQERLSVGSTQPPQIRTTSPLVPTIDALASLTQPDDRTIFPKSLRLQ